MFVLANHLLLCRGFGVFTPHLLLYIILKLVVLLPCMQVSFCQNRLFLCYHILSLYHVVCVLVGLSLLWQVV